MSSHIQKLTDRIKYLEEENERLKESENLYRTLIDTLSDPIIISSLAGKVEFASAAALNAVGSKNGKGLIGTNIMDRLDKKGQHKLRENIHKMINRHPYNHEEYEIIKDKETVFQAEIRTTLLRNEAGAPDKLILLLQDISYRKKTEEVLRETQNLYRTIIELSPEGILIAHKGVVLFLNSAMARILDTGNPWEIAGQKFYQVVKRKYLKKVKDTLEGVEKNKQTSQVIDFQIESMGEVVKAVSMIASPIVYDGKDCVFLFISDITERISAEKRLKRETQLMDAFWAHLPDSITFKNKKGQYLRVNDEFLKWIKHKNAQDIIGKTDKEIFGTKHFQLSKREEKEVIEKGAAIVNEIREEIWPGNDRKWVMLTKMPLYDIDQKVVGVFSFTRDITREKTAEIEIREREERFRHIFDHSPIGKIITDKHFNIKTANKSATDLIGFGVEGIMGKKVFTLFPKDQGKLLREKLRSAAHTFQHELLLKSSNAEKNVIVQGTKILSPHKEGEYLIHLIDIHSRKIAEDLLLIRNTELNNFVYKVSHDLKAPLTSIKGLINLVKLENDPRVFHEYVEMISGRVERLDLFIRDVLSHSKNLNVEVTVEPVDLQKIIDECISQISFNPNYKSVRREVRVSGTTLYSDPQRLHEILRNLISNAFQYSRVKSPAPYVRIETKTTKKKCEIVVEDNGVGIKKKYQSRIFEMFYRANERVEGSGIGLYIVKQSIEKLNGKISFTSTMNKGTRFEISIPNHG